MSLHPISILASHHLLDPFSNRHSLYLFPHVHQSIPHPFQIHFISRIHFSFSYLSVNLYPFSASIFTGSSAHPAPISVPIFYYVPSFTLPSLLYPLFNLRHPLHPFPRVRIFILHPFQPPLTSPAVSSTCLLHPFISTLIFMSRLSVDHVCYFTCSSSPRTHFSRASLPASILASPLPLPLPSPLPAIKRGVTRRSLPLRRSQQGKMPR